MPKGGKEGKQMIFDSIESWRYPVRVWYPDMSKEEADWIDYKIRLKETRGKRQPIPRYRDPYGRLTFDIPIGEKYCSLPIWVSDMLITPDISDKEVVSRVIETDDSISYILRSSIESKRYLHFNKKTQVFDWRYLRLTPEYAKTEATQKLFFVIKKIQEKKEKEEGERKYQEFMAQPLRNMFLGHCTRFGANDPVHESDCEKCGKHLAGWCQNSVTWNGCPYLKD